MCAFMCTVYKYIRFMYTVCTCIVCIGQMYVGSDVQYMLNMMLAQAFQLEYAMYIH